MERLPSPPPYDRSSTNYESRKNQSSTGWESIQPRPGSIVPCQRSLHAGAVWKDCFVVFGGYDGQHRVNDLYSFNFKQNSWQQLSNIDAPSPRDRHVAVVCENHLYIFGGFDGVARVNDLHSYDLENNRWNAVLVAAGNPPTPRHSHAAIVYQDCMYIFGGYDGSYRCDFHCFHFPTRTWRTVHGLGEIPRARYRGTCVVCNDSMILHGGHDGNRHLQDTHIFDFPTQTWSMLVTEGPVPSPRDSHVAVIYAKSMYLYGGSTGSAMGDFHELKLEFRRVWGPVLPPNNNNNTTMSNGNTGSASRYHTGNHTTIINNINGIVPPPPPDYPDYPTTTNTNTNNTGNGNGMDTGNLVISSPGPRFCHVGVVYEHAFYIFGGYDGGNRLNDFLRYTFDTPDTRLDTPPSTIISDLRQYVNSALLSDVQFVVEGRPIFAHKILCLRCPYFHNLLTGEYMESRASAITIEEVKHSTFLLLLEYLYTDEVVITVETAMELFQVADRFGMDRLKSLCEQEMLSAIDIDTAAHILYTADQHNACYLRERCLAYILAHFDTVSRTLAFEEMGRINVDLIFEILKRR